MQKDFRFITVCRTGKEYTEAHVEWLQRQIGEPIYCLTNSIKPMKDVISIPLQYNWEGWWSKIELFRPDIIAGGNFLFADLDTVFLKGIPEDFKTLTKTAPLRSVSGVDRYINSGLMFIAQDCPKAIWEDFVKEPEALIQRFKSHPKRVMGDQDYLNPYLVDCPKLQELFPGQIVSYKVNLRTRRHNGMPKSPEHIICFHGQPRPWAACLHWVPKL